MDYIKEFNELDNIELNTISKNDIASMIADELVKAIGPRDCIVVDNVIYYILDEFEAYSDDSEDLVPVERGIFFIIEVTPDLKFNLYSPKYPELKDIEEIGSKPLSYFVDERNYIFSNKNLDDFVYEIDSYMGRGWFDSTGRSKDVIDSIKMMTEDIDVDVEGLSDFPYLFPLNYVDYGIDNIVISPEGKSYYFDFDFTDELSFGEMQDIKLEVVNGFNCVVIDLVFNDCGIILPKNITDAQIKRLIKLLKFYTDDESKINWYNNNYSHLFTTDGFDSIESSLLLKKQNLKEDDEIEPYSKEETIEQTKDMSFEDLYDNFGDDLFTTYSYLLDDSSVGDLVYEYGSVIKQTDYLKNRVINEFDEKFPNGMDYEFDVDELDYENREVGKEFIRDALRGDVLDYFDYSFEDMDVSLIVDKLDNKNKQRILNLGFSEEDIENCSNRNYDSPMSEFYSDLHSALVVAAEDGYRFGSESEALRDIEGSFEQSIPDGVEIKNIDKRYDGKYILHISREYVLNKLDDIMDGLNEISDDLSDVIGAKLVEDINDNFSFYPPRYGYSDFSEECFNGSLDDWSLSELENAVNKKIVTLNPEGEE